MKVKLTITNTGGEFSMGVVSDEKAKEFLLELAEEESLSANNSNDDLNVDFYEKQDVLGVYGPSVDNANFLIEEIDEDGDTVDEIYNSDETDEEINIQTIEINCPFVNTEKLLETFSEDDLIFGGYSIEKNIQQSYIIETDNFDSKNIVLGYIILDETLGDYPILSKVFYIDNEALTAMWELYNEGQELTLEEVREDCIREMYDAFESDEDTSKFALFTACEIQMADQEPGESKELQAVLLNMDGEEIFATWN